MISIRNYELLVYLHYVLGIYRSLENLYCKLNKFVTAINNRGPVTYRLYKIHVQVGKIRRLCAIASSYNQHNVHLQALVNITTTNVSDILNNVYDIYCRTSSTY